MVQPSGPSGTWNVAWNDEFNNATGMSGNTNGLDHSKWNVGWYFGPSAPGGTGYTGTSFTDSSPGGAIEFYGPGALTFPVAGGMEMSCFASGAGPDGNYDSGGHSSTYESGGVNTAGLMNITPNTGYSVPSNIASTVIQASSIVLEVQCKMPGPSSGGQADSYWAYIGHYNCGNCNVPDYPGAGTYAEELDIWEELGGDSTGASYDLHFHAASTYNGPSSVPSSLSSTDMSLASHIYTVEYTYSTIQVWVDGIAVSGISPTTAEMQAQWATPQYLNILFQLHPGYTATGANGATPWLIDYVRVFTPSTGPPEITSTGSISLQPFKTSGTGSATTAGNISQDGSTPAVATAAGSAATSLTTASFSPPANTLLVVMTSFEYQAANANTPVFTVSDSASGTYVAGPSVFDGSRGMAAIWTQYLFTAPGAMTVTVTNSGPSATHGQILSVYVLDNAGSVQTKGAAATGHSATAVTAWTEGITTTVSGSWVLAAGAGSVAATVTPQSTTTGLTNQQDSTDQVSLLTGKQCAATVKPGAVTLGWTSGTAGEYAIALMEILPLITPPPPPFTLTMQAVKRAAYY